MKNKLKNVTIFIILLIETLIIVSSIYYYNNYPRQDFDVIFFTFTTGVQKTSPDVVNGIIARCVIPFLLLLTLLALPIIRTVNEKYILKFRCKKKNKAIKLFPIGITSNHRVIYLIIIFIISIAIFIKCFCVDEYIKHRFQKTKIFDMYYVNSSNVNIAFPDKKRNLIIIIGESFENSVLSLTNGGAWETSLMPELETLALENTSFSNSDKLGGALQTYGTDYSAGGNVAITSGIPLKTVDILSDKNNYLGNGRYLDGSYSLRRSFKK